MTTRITRASPQRAGLFFCLFLAFCCVVGYFIDLARKTDLRPLFARSTVIPDMDCSPSTTVKSDLFHFSTFYKRRCNKSHLSQNRHTDAPARDMQSETMPSPHACRVLYPLLQQTCSESICKAPRAFVSDESCPLYVSYPLESFHSK